jgi:hypothetical protein
MRRVKCDETKPNCQRCLNSGRICDGYPSPEAQGWEVVTSACIPSIRPPLGDPRLLFNSKAGPSLEFFRLRTVSQLCNLFDSPFWQESIFRAAQNNDTIWHAVVAVGAAHRDIDSRGDGSSDEWAICQYSKAMSHITRAKCHKEALSFDVTLTVCLLFAAYEVQYNRA